MSPSKNTLPIGLPLYEFPLVYVTVLEPLIPSSVPFIVAPLPFIDSAVIVYYHSSALTLPVSQLSLIDSVLVLLDTECIHKLDDIIVKLIALHIVIDKVLLVIRQVLYLSLCIHRRHLWL